MIRRPVRVSASLECTLLTTGRVAQVQYLAAW